SPAPRRAAPAERSPPTPPPPPRRIPRNAEPRASWPARGQTPVHNRSERTHVRGLPRQGSADQQPDPYDQHESPRYPRLRTEGSTRPPVTTHFHGVVERGVDHGQAAHREGEQARHRPVPAGVHRRREP